MEGGSVPIEEMIRATKRGLLVTRLWYTNMLDPRSLLLTGLTRDGNFLIEDGRVVAPARNLRFNQSLATLFARIEALGPSRAHMARAAGRRALRRAADARVRRHLLVALVRHLTRADAVRKDTGAKTIVRPARHGYIGAANGATEDSLQWRSSSIRITNRRRMSRS